MPSCDIPAEQVERGIDRVVVEMLTEAKIAEPPVTSLGVARALGMYVSFDRRLANRARFVRVRGAGAGILLKEDERPERLQWATAHEIGEASAERITASIGLGDSEFTSRDRESLANQFAAALLLPTAWFAGAGDVHDWDLAALKATFATASHELIARRMLHFSPEAIVTIFDQGSVSFRARSFERRAPRLSALELAAQQTAFGGGGFVEHSDENQRVRAWPVHEPHWRREVVRTEQLEF